MAYSKDNIKEQHDGHSIEIQLQCIQMTMMLSRIYNRGHVQGLRLEDKDKEKDM